MLSSRDTAGRELSQVNAARFVRLAFLIYAILLMLTIVKDIWLTGLFSGDGGRGVLQRFGQIEDLILWLLVATLASLLVNVVAFLIWQYHAAQAVVVRADIESPPISPGWHVGWWFIPIANFVMPAVAIGQLHRASRVGTKGIWSELPYPFLVLAWWLVFVLHSVAAQFIGRLLEEAETTEAVTQFIWADTVSNLVQLVGIYLVLRIVGNITSAQLEWTR